MPKVRIGRHWVNLLWALPAAFVILIVAIALAQALRQQPSVQAFLIRYPGEPASVKPLISGFPSWLRLSHFLNLFFMIFIIRAGIQILADHPRLYWKRDCTPGTEWFRFQKDVPTDRVWTAKDDSVTLPGWLGIPGICHSIGLARWWHFSVNLLWTLNGVAIYILLFSTDQWRRIVPTTWDVFPNAISTALQIPVRAGHAPAAATTLLITLGGLKADLGTVGVLVVGIGVATFLCDCGRRLVTYEFHQVLEWCHRLLRALPKSLDS